MTHSTIPACIDPNATITSPSHPRRLLEIARLRQKAVVVHKHGFEGGQPLSPAYSLSNANTSQYQFRYDTTYEAKPIDRRIYWIPNPYGAGKIFIGKDEIPQQRLATAGSQLVPGGNVVRVDQIYVIDL